jgi:hypothetical protein
MKGKTRSVDASSLLPTFTGAICRNRTPSDGKFCMPFTDGVVSKESIVLSWALLSGPAVRAIMELPNPFALTANRRRWSSWKHSHLRPNCLGRTRFPSRRWDFVMRKSNIVTGSPAGHGLVGDPLQIYADRFSGHYERDAGAG